MAEAEYCYKSGYLSTERESIELSTCVLRDNEYEFLLYITCVSKQAIPKSISRVLLQDWLLGYRKDKTDLSTCVLKYRQQYGVLIQDWLLGYRKTRGLSTCVLKNRSVK